MMTEFDPGVVSGRCYWEMDLATGETWGDPRGRTMKSVTIDAGTLTLPELGRALRNFGAAIEAGDITPAQEGSWRGDEAGITWNNTAPEPTEPGEA